MKTTPSPIARRRSSGSALVITLTILTLLTVVVVGYMATVILELRTARSARNEQKAQGMATLAMHSAVAQLREALGTGTASWDNPFDNFMGTRAFTVANSSSPLPVAVGGNPPEFFWSISPGRLTRWSYDSIKSATNIALFSGTSGGDAPTVDLNRRRFDGSYPIIGGANPPPVKVQWVNVLADPSQEASATNKLVGRYAFWVDDENAKININTADGTNKADAKKSLGAGTPSEVSLQVLSQAGTAITKNIATEIVRIARTTGFHSLREILRADGTRPELYTENVFNLTYCGRSPELNIFGEPKMNLISASQLSNWRNPYQGRLQQNNITTQPLTEIYPTPAQTGAFTLYDHRYNWRSVPWLPFVFPQDFVTIATKAYEGQGDAPSWVPNFIALHLGGTNSMGKPIQWPVFEGSGTNGFVGKYSLRQLDSIAIQIADIGQKTLTPEEPNYWYGDDVSYRLSYTIPTIWWGLLSNQVVSGVGRSAKVNEVLINLSTTGPNLTGSTPHPSMTMKVFVELWLPAGYGGVDLLNINNGLPPARNSQEQYGLGLRNGDYQGALNAMDLPVGVTEVDAKELNPDGIEVPVTKPGVNSNGLKPSCPFDGSGSPTCFSPYVREAPQDVGLGTRSCWHDTILQNDAGVDFYGNNGDYPDGDQKRAAAYHPYALASSTSAFPGLYMGLSPLPGTVAPGTRMSYGSSTLLRMGHISSASYNQSGKTAWLPGQYRTVSNYYANTSYEMKPGATSITLSGGLIITGHTVGGDPDPTPLEAGVRGKNGFIDFNSYYDEDLNLNPWLKTATRYNNEPANPAQTNQSTDPVSTLRDRVGPHVSTNGPQFITAGGGPTLDPGGVIPVNFTVPVSDDDSSGEDNSIWYDVQVADPLVNKFPGDWIVQPLDSVKNTGTDALPSTGGGINFSYGGRNAAATSGSLQYRDPDSFWLPTLSPLIPRSARMPNIGYLNYVRTGIIPDDETVPLSQQKGTPYRLLNFAPSDDASQKLDVAETAKESYPDWAILDLFTIPSLLTAYGSPYGYQDHGNPAVLSGTMIRKDGANIRDIETMRAYSTFGGSTPGRINPNGAVIYTTDVDKPAKDGDGKPILRTLPLQAMLYGLKMNQSISSGTSDGSATVGPPTFRSGIFADKTAVPTKVDEAEAPPVGDGGRSLAEAIAKYIADNGPLRMPAEICNIPAVAEFYPNDANHKNRTRNDLVRQVVGNLTTQSNTFSVWVAGQAIQKRPRNTGYDEFEPGDQVLGEKRYHFIVERYLDPGANGVYGNLATPGNDGLAGTYDDPVAPILHPPNPRYFYRVIASEEIL